MCDSTNLKLILQLNNREVIKMSHGWKSRRGDAIKKSQCKCGEGFVIIYEVEEESDYPPFERTSTERVVECPKNCQVY